MPLGHTHEKMNIAFTLTVSTLAPPALLVAGVPLGTTILVVTPYVLGAAVSIVITPDLLDVDEDPLPEKRLRTVPIIGDFYAWIFDLVSVRIPHRGFPSHGFWFWIGTLLSFLLLSPLSWLLFLPSLLFWPWGFLVFFGKMSGDAIHVIADELTTRFKHRRTKVRRWFGR